MLPCLPSHVSCILDIWELDRWARLEFVGVHIPRRRGGVMLKAVWRKVVEVWDRV